MPRKVPAYSKRKCASFRCQLIHVYVCGETLYPRAQFLVICIVLWWNKVEYLWIACVWWFPNQRLHPLCEFVGFTKASGVPVCYIAEEYCWSGFTRLSILRVSCIELFTLRNLIDIKTFYVRVTWVLFVSGTKTIREFCSVLTACYRVRTQF